MSRAGLETARKVEGTADFHKRKRLATIEAVATINGPRKALVAKDATQFGRVLRNNADAIQPSG